MMKVNNLMKAGKVNFLNKGNTWNTWSLHGWGNLYRIGLSTFIFIKIMKIFIWLTTARDSVTRNIDDVKVNNLMKAGKVDFLDKGNTWNTCLRDFLISTHASAM